MKKSFIPQQDLSDLERDVMMVLWSKNLATSRQIKEELDASRPLALTTILTILARLKKKNYIEEIPSTGRAMVFRPLVPREPILRKNIRGILAKFFSGSPSSLVSHLLHDELVSREELIEIKKLIEARIKD